MSRGDLQEMEVGTKQSKGPVTANAKPGDPMPKLTTGGTPASYEDLGGPSPDNYKPCLLYTSPSPRDLSTSRMPSSA